METKTSCDSMNTDTKSSLKTPIYKTEKLVRDKFALLAMVGHRKRKALAYREAEEFYSTIVSEQHATLVELLVVLKSLAEVVPALNEVVTKHTSVLHRLTRMMLNFWPKNLDSQATLLSLLGSKELRPLLAYTPDGYVSLSTDLILDNVERAIGATAEQPPSH